jgi:Putative MetA-pathway of phenol degradation
MRRLVKTLLLFAIVAVADLGRAPAQTPPASPMPQSPAQTAPTSPTPAAPETQSPFQPITSAALGDSFVAMTAPGYLDPAAPMTVFRLRYDSERDINRPDRAEFFYAKNGLLGGRGVDELQSTLDTQQLMAYLEVAPVDTFSFFAEIPYRRIKEAADSDIDKGISDISFGTKAALIRESDRVLSLQMKAYAPTGEASLGLGNGHWTIEPSLLAWRKLGERTQIYAQFGDWIPVTDSDFAGNVLEYGVGASYTLIDRGCFRVCPIVEMLGWTVLSGKEFTGLETPIPMVVDSAGTTIVNGKIGVRFETEHQSIYVGYGHALTPDFWYRDILRVEYRFRF